MKYFMLITFFALNAQAESKEFRFVYRFTQNKIIQRYTCSAKGTWESAFEKCAKECASSMMNMRFPSGEDRKWDIVDTCANPRDT